MLDERRFDTGEITLNYAEGPDTGPSLVLIHGGAARWQGFLPIIPALSARWHIYALDLRGHGRSEWAPQRYRLDNYVADLLAFLDRQVGRSAVLMGHSLGGMIALLAAARVPRSTRAVILADTPLALTNLRQRVSATAAEAEQRNARSAQPHDPTAAGAVLVRDFDAIFAAWQPTEVLPAVTCPVLFLQADPGQGGAVSDDDVTQLSRLLSSIRRVRFQGLSHGLWAERPTQVLAAITAFLDALPPV